MFVALLIDPGARKGELLERRWGEVDLDKREILAPTTKSGTPRVLFFCAETADLIRRVYPESQRRPGAMLFEGPVPGQSISYRRQWNVTTAEIGLDDFHIHDVQHAAAVSLLRAGVTLAVAAQVLGHDPAVLSRRYGHLETAALRRAQEACWSHRPADEGVSAATAASSASVAVRLRSACTSIAVRRKSVPTMTTSHDWVTSAEAWQTFVQAHPELG